MLHFQKTIVARDITNDFSFESLMMDWCCVNLFLKVYKAHISLGNAFVYPSRGLLSLTSWHALTGLWFPFLFLNLRVLVILWVFLQRS